MRPSGRFCPDRKQKIEEPIPLAQWARTSRLTMLGPYITLSPVGSDGMHSLCDTDQPVADGPVGPSVTLGPVGPRRTLSQCNPDQPVVDGPVGPSVTLGPVGPEGRYPSVTLISWWLMARWACRLHSAQWARVGCYPSVTLISRWGSTDEPGLVGPRGKLFRIDIKTVVTTDEPATSIGTSPSSDSGIHSLGEQWEDTSVITTDTEEEQNRTSRIYTPTGWRVSDTCIPPNTEEDQVTLCPWIDCLFNQESDESSEIDIRNNDRDPQWNGTAEFYSNQELTTD